MGYTQSLVYMFIQRKILSIRKPTLAIQAVTKGQAQVVPISLEIGLKLTYQETLGLEVILDLAHSILCTVELENAKKC